MADPFDPGQSLDGISFAIFDVETTGLNPVYGHRICEVACLCLQQGVEVARFESLVDPGRSISPGAFAVNQITPDLLENAPAFECIGGDLLALMEDAILVAHNAPFDLGFLATELQIAGLPPPEGPVIDTLTLSRRMYDLASHSLSAVVYALQVPVEPTHRAMSDVQATRHVLERMLWDLDHRWGVETLGQLLDFQGGPIPYPHPRALPLPPEIAEALSAKGRVFMRYVDARGQETERVIQPIHVNEQRGFLYLTAHCFRAGDVRTFRLDRILEMAVED
jgi:DNA polymerase III epsilon subunit family exonuclease